METWWLQLSSLFERYCPIWVSKQDNVSKRTTNNANSFEPPSVQQLFQAADPHQDRALVLTGPKKFQVLESHLSGTQVSTRNSVGEFAFCHVQASREDFRSLQGCNWLNDEIVNLYMQLLQVGALHNVAVIFAGSSPNTALACMLLTALPAYQAKSLAARPDAPEVFVFNTFFWTRLACFGNDFDYAGITASV